MISRKEKIKEKGFSMQMMDEQTNQGFSYDGDVELDFSKLKVGAQTLNDAVLDLGTFKKVRPELANIESIIKAIESGDLETMREASRFFYKTSGIYSRLCRYLAYLYRYDWILTPYMKDKGNKKSKSKVDSEKGNEKIIETFNEALYFLDNLEIKRIFGDIALKVVRDGCYYGYLIGNEDRVAIQELPIKYCRSRFVVNGHPTVEFNMKFFDDMYRDSTQRMAMLKAFPKEFEKGYKLFKQKKLEDNTTGRGKSADGWYLLDVNSAIKFNLNGDDFPVLIAVIRPIIELDEAKALDKKKMAQQLLKIIIQKMPLDKNGDLVFDIDEAQQLHNNVVRMLNKAIGVDVLTTFADVDVADMSDRGNLSSKDELEKVERGIYNEAGVSQMQFNTNGNLALEKSVLNDEAFMYNLVGQFESFLNMIIKRFNKSPKKYFFRVQILTTTIYNYKELSKLYKEQTQLGYSKMLPQIALGQSQSSVLANAYFENDLLDLVNVFIPPLMSSTMNSDTAAAVTGKGEAKGKKLETNKKGGRPEKSDDEKSEKTIMNKESLS